MKQLITVILFLSACLASQAQLIVAQECAIKEGDITAYRMNDNQPIVEDGDTIPFAIVRVGLAEPNATFDSKWVLKQEYKDNEYWVYCMEGLKSMTIKTKRFAPLHYKFPESLKAKNLYTMTIHKPEGEKYKGTLNIHSNVANADIYVDGVKVSDGAPFTYTGDGGVHQVEIRADGYDSQMRDVDVPMGQSLDITINLFAAGSLSVGGVSYGMVPVEAATFSMGSPINYYSKPMHNVSLRPFSIGSNFVSADLWDKVMGSSNTNIRGENGEVVNVSHDEVMDFISELNRITGKEFRLPTEAEWEYIARNASKLGVDGIGRDMEWCADWFGRYDVGDTTNPRGPESGYLRSVRGGSEYSDLDPIYKNAAFRWRKSPDKGSKEISFRLVQDL